ncbi:hypothetical protein Tco_1382707 [Tanacetum coccineum]
MHFKHGKIYSCDVLCWPEAPSSRDPDVVQDSRIALEQGYAISCFKIKKGSTRGFSVCWLMEKDKGETDINSILTSFTYTMEKMEAQAMSNEAAKTDPISVVAGADKTLDDLHAKPISYANIMNETQPKI